MIVYHDKIGLNTSTSITKCTSRRNLVEKRNTPSKMTYIMKNSCKRIEKILLDYKNKRTSVKSNNSKININDPWKNNIFNKKELDLIKNIKSFYELQDKAAKYIQRNYKEYLKSKYC